jgi:hypothetical protein
MMRRLTLSSRAAAWILGVGAVLALTGGIVAGMRLGEAASRPAVEEVRVTDPASEPTTSGIEWRSPAGFTGFGGPPALEGSVLRRGVTVDVRSGSFALVDGAARSQVEYTQPLRLYRVSPSTAPLASGDSVVVRVENGRATGVLRVRLPAGTAPR